MSSNDSELSSYSKQRPLWVWQAGRWKGSVKHVRQPRQNAQTKAVHNAFPQARAYKQRSRVNYVIVMNNKEAIGGYPGRSSCRLAFVTYLTYL